MLKLIRSKMKSLAEETRRNKSRIAGRSGGTQWGVVLAILTALFQCRGQGTSTWITFDGPPVIAAGTSKLVQEYYESGMSFSPIDPNAPWAVFARNGGGITFYPDDGTAYLQAGVGSTLMFNSMNGSLFNLISVDLAEYSTVVPDAVAVHFVGYRQDGSVVTTDLMTDGIIDGTGPLADFQTFYFGPEFSGLSRVEIPSEPWSLDNLVVVTGIPEPGTGTLVMLGAVLAALGSTKRKS